METERKTNALLAACLAALAALCAAQGAWAAPRPKAAFDRARVHADYQAGDFEKVIPALEGFLESGARCRKEDSVFLEKHLAVVYAANPATRERGRYHLMRMLELDPAADLLDMFVGEEVDRIFEKVRRESAVRRAAAPSPPRPAPAQQTFRKPAGPTPRLGAWDLGPVPPASRDGRAAAAPASRTAPAARVPASQAAFPGDAAFPEDPRPSADAAAAAAGIRPPESPAAGGREAGAARASLFRPRWQEPGFWVGGGAMVAVVGLTLYFSGARSESDSRSRTYAVPAQPGE